MAQMEMKTGVDSVVTSPPYEAATDRRVPHGGRVADGEGGFRGHYSDNSANLGNPQGVESDTFWTAARDIVRECHAVLKPGGYACWIVKSFVRDKTIVNFPNDWRRLCEYVGFETVAEAHAMLVKTHEYTNLFGEEDVEKKERKSFFRRLAESKGSPKIDYEVVLIMRKPS